MTEKSAYVQYDVGSAILLNYILKWHILFGQVHGHLPVGV